MAKVKTKGKKKSSLSVVKKNAIKKKVMNPFEVHLNRQKFEVLGRKVKNDKGLPGVARAKAMKKRKATLLQEYRVRDKSNKFMDRRIGEKNRAMTGEDRIMARFTAERMKAHNKKSMFNLADDEVLTHHGQTLNELEKFDDPRSEDEDEAEEGKLDAHFVKEAHFGGGILSRPGNPQSRKDLIEQLIAESKQRKADQKKNREQTQELTDKLDTEWKDLLPIVATSKRKADDGAAEAVDRPDEYDTMMRELKFEARGRPSDRLKSEDEIAREEKERLEKLEADRLQRMHGITESKKPKITHRSADDLDDGFAVDSDDDDNIVSYDAEGKLEHRGSSQGADEMDAEVDDEESEDGVSENDESSSSEEDGDNDDLADLKSDSDEEVDEDDVEEAPRKKSPKVSKADDVETKDISQDNATADSHEESENADSDCVSVKQESDEEVEHSAPQFASTTVTDIKSLGKDLLDESEVLAESVATSRIDKKIVSPGKEPLATAEVTVDEDKNDSEAKARNLESIKKDLLARKEIMDAARKELPFTFKVPQNFEDLQLLLADCSPDYQAVILERIIKCNHPSLADGNKDKLATLLAFLLQHLHDKASQDDGECFVVLDRLAPHLYDLAIMAPSNARRCVAAVLKEKQHDYRKRPRNFPARDTLVFLKLISLLFPTSDFRHPVVTPAFVFMGQLLSKCRVRTRRDVATGLFLATMILEYTVLSKRFSPEVITFLIELLRSATPEKSSTMKSILRLSSEYTPSSEINSLSLEELSKEDPTDDAFRYKAVSLTTKLLEEFRSNLNDLPAAYQVFISISALDADKFPATLRSQCESLQAAVNVMGEKKMPRLVPEAKKPKVMRLYEPNIEKVFDGRKHRVMSRERQEQAKLIHKVKRETKGAIREIRRDRTFLAKLKIKSTHASDMERREKVKEIYGSAANQQGELNALARKKKK